MPVEIEPATLIRERLPGWRALRDQSGLRRLAVDITPEDIPDASDRGGFWLLAGLSPSGNAHSVCLPTLDECIDHFKAMEAKETNVRAAVVEKLRKLLKEKAHAEIPRPVHDGSASAGDGAGSESTAAADHPDPAGHGPGLASAQAQPEDQSSAADAVAVAALDADFSEPETPPQAQAEQASEPGGGDTIIEGHKPAEPPAYGGTLIDDTRERLSAEVDAEARARIDACDAILRDTPMAEINNARMYGSVTDAQAAQEAAFYATQTRRVAVAETAAKLKRALWEMAPDRLSTFKPGEPSLWPT